MIRRTSRTFAPIKPARPEEGFIDEVGCPASHFFCWLISRRSRPTKFRPLIRSVQGGRWSNAATWEGGRIPGPGTRVQVRAGHVVVYDIETKDPIRSIHVAGTLQFDPDRDTRLDVGLIKIQAGDDRG